MKYAGLLALLSLWLILGCRQPIKEGNKNDAGTGSMSQGEKYLIDPKQSVVEWEGSMLISPEGEHAGYVHISKGDLLIDNGQLVGGMAVLDMNSLEYKDKADNNTPIHHLKSPDYFDVAKFPTSTISITKVTTVGGSTLNVTGDLTIKGITRPVTFPAKVDVQAGMVKATGKLIIDRTEWGIRYRSGKFYDIIADQTVSDDIEFHMSIIARKKSS